MRRPIESAQYTSIAFGTRCREAGVRPSMGSVGDAYNNAMAESFFATLECELLDRSRFKTQSRSAHRHVHIQAGEGGLCADANRPSVISVNGVCFSLASKQSRYAIP